MDLKELDDFTLTHIPPILCKILFERFEKYESIPLEKDKMGTIVAVFLSGLCSIVTNTSEERTTFFNSIVNMANECFKIADKKEKGDEK